MLTYVRSMTFCPSLVDILLSLIETQANSCTRWARMKLSERIVSTLTIFQKISYCLIQLVDPDQWLWIQIHLLTTAYLLESGCCCSVERTPQQNFWPCELGLASRYETWSTFVHLSLSDGLVQDYSLPNAVGQDAVLYNQFNKLVNKARVGQLTQTTRRSSARSDSFNHLSFR